MYVLIYVCLCVCDAVVYQQNLQYRKKNNGKFSVQVRVCMKWVCVLFEITAKVYDGGGQRHMHTHYGSLTH